MKRILLIGVLAISLLLAACAPGEETLAGEGYKIPKDIRPIPVDTGISRGDLFLLQAPVRAPSNSNTVGEILRYSGSDRNTKTSPKIKFMRWSTGETLEYAVADEVFIQLGGKRFQVKVLNPTRDDSQIQVDYNGDGTIDRSTSSKLYNGGAAGLMGTGVSCNELIEPLVGETMLTSGDPTGANTQNLTLMYVDLEKVQVNSNNQTIQIDLGDSATFGNLNVHVLRTLVQDYAGGIHQATLCIN